MKILIVDDEASINSSLQEILESSGHEVTTTGSGDHALRLLSQSTPDVLMIDLHLPQSGGLEILRNARNKHPEVTCVIMTAQGSIDTAIQAIRNGAFDYLLKPFSLDQLEATMTKIEKQRAIEEVDLIPIPQSMASKSSKMQKVFSMAARVADTDSTVLITGESGTGKTLLAKLIHDRSPRRNAPFAVVNCATLSPSLLESELFGHARGSFTGAIKDKVGRLQAADSGTVFLDEIGEISPELQTKLLRFLQDREFERIGETRTLKVDVRVIAATNKNLLKEVSAGNFREDLYYRLNVIELFMPSLRERQEDLPDLVNFLLEQAFSTLRREPKPLSRAARDAILAHSWPGNIRDLKNALERAAVLCGSDEVTTDDLPDRVTGNTFQTALSNTIAQEFPPHMSLDEVERKRIEQVLLQTRTLEEATNILGISPATLWRKRKQYGIVWNPIDPEVPVSA